MSESELEYLDEGAIVRHSNDQPRDVVRSSPPDEQNVSTGQSSRLEVTSMSSSPSTQQFFSGAQGFDVTAGSMNNAQNIHHYINCTWISPAPQQAVPPGNPAAHDMHDSPQRFEDSRRLTENRQSSRSQGDFSGAARVRASSTLTEGAPPEQQSASQSARSSQEPVHRPSGQGPVPSPPQQNATSSRLSGHGQRVQTGATHAPPSPPPSPPTRSRWWSPRSPPKRSDADLYVSQMMTRSGLGYPLWLPGPNLAEHIPVSHRQNGISLGDVGIITPKGLFDFFFNIFVPRDHPLNGEGKNVPDGFSPCDWTGNTLQTSMPAGSTISSSSIDVKVARVPMSSPSPFCFTVINPPGATCALPSAAETVTISDLEVIEAYIAANAMDWYYYFSQMKGRTLHDGSLYVATGTTKSDRWGLFAIDDVPGARGTRVVFEPFDLHPTMYHWSASRLGAVNVRGVDDEFPNEKNQTLFITGFRLSLGRKYYCFGPPDGVRLPLPRLENATRPMQASQWVPFPARSGGGGSGGGGDGRGRNGGRRSTEFVSDNGRVASSANTDVFNHPNHSGNVSSQINDAEIIKVSCQADKDETKGKTSSQVFHPADSVHEYIRAEV
ncbi:hypothetical protein C8R47DRAFT_424132 [Mycena vitilis]|nr:hypothetical protein C8R47DRAFT_424132 [Mycena vitilis]